jgi:hypothetical protein
MKIAFADGSYIELSRSKTSNKVWVTVAAKQQSNPLELVVNAAEVEALQLLDALKTIMGPLVVEKEKQQ